MPALQAHFDRPDGIVVDHDGTMYFADQNNNRIRRIAPNGVMTTLAGAGNPGYSGDNQQAAAAQINIIGTPYSGYDVPAA